MIILLYFSSNCDPQFWNIDTWNFGLLVYFEIIGILVYINFVNIEIFLPIWIHQRYDVPLKLLHPSIFHHIIRPESVIFCISMGFPKFQHEYTIDWLDTLPRNHYFPAKPAPQVPKHHALGSDLCLSTCG